MKKIKKWALAAMVLFMLLCPVKTMAAETAAAPEGAEWMEEPSALAELPEEWEKYRNCYYYGKLPEKEKDLYRWLDKICAGYLTSDRDVRGYGNIYGGDVYTEYAPVDDLKQEEIQQVVELFLNDNPQYFFTETNLLTLSRAGKISKVALRLYPAFVNGRARLEAAEKIQSTLDSVVQTAGLKGSAKEKALYVHDWIVRNNTYAAGGYDQSIYGVVCKKTSVCTGYSKMFAACCNALGYKTICVTSRDGSTRHMYNKTLIGSTWYNYDCTWDDTDEGDVVLSTWATRSDASFAKGEYKKYHTPEKELKKLVPGKKK